MPTNHLGIIEINEAPPPRDPTPQELAAVANELVHSHAAFAALYSRRE